MTAPRQYTTAGALRTALEARLNERSRRDGVDSHRLRRQVAFDRLLARMFDPSQPARDGWVLKGGYALEMRFRRARSTKDLDLTVRSRGERFGESLLACFRQDRTHGSDTPSRRNDRVSSRYPIDYLI